MRTVLRPVAVVLAGALLALGLSAALTAPASASEAGAATLAAANIDKSAGTCAVHPTHNSLGGDQYHTSCSGGYSGGPEYWCADFAIWVWSNSGLSVSGLTAAAASFNTYGHDNSTYQSVARAGDAITFSTTKGGTSHHVAIVTAVNADGSLETANGDFGGESGSMEHFATTSSVEAKTIPGSEAYVGAQVPNVDDFYITGIVGPAGSGGSSSPGGNPYSAPALCGSGYSVIDSHAITGATIELLYSSGSGQNCVVTMAAADKGSVSMNATLAVQGGSSGSDPGSYTWYAGPVRESAPGECVMWGGAYNGASWTSAWSHCG